ncbi:MAG: hypothetical protein M1401_03675 [Chloroflexi bacterium]|nr:hypothetical protein [Chloroflexota bacterium]MCL5107963.1 hypothetical protein [Chloroflexota bacterium]
MAAEEEESGLLNRFIEGLLVGDERQAWSLVSGSAELTALAWLARSLRQALRPVEPEPAFRASLHATLVSSAIPARREESWATQHRTELLIGAALGSTLSIAGVVALVLRRRQPARRAA